MPTFQHGDRIQFWSSDRGGMWKLGVIDAVYHANGCATGNVRIKVGEGVWIIRPAKKCRLVAKRRKRVAK